MIELCCILYVFSMFILREICHGERSAPHAQATGRGPFLCVAQKIWLLLAPPLLRSLTRANSVGFCLLRSSHAPQRVTGPLGHLVSCGPERRRQV